MTRMKYCDQITQIYKIKQEKHYFHFRNNVHNSPFHGSDKKRQISLHNCIYFIYESNSAVPLIAVAQSQPLLSDICRSFANCNTICISVCFQNPAMNVATIC